VGKASGDKLSGSGPRRLKRWLTRAHSKTPPVSTSTTLIGYSTERAPLIKAQETTSTNPPSTSEARNGRTEKYGLFLLDAGTALTQEVEARGSNAVDIVAVHGITGDAFDTWTHKDGSLWLRDFIPKDFPGARVFSYGYPAEVFCTLGKGTLDTYARSLLEGLRRERRKKEVRIFSTRILLGGEGERPPRNNIFVEILTSKTTI
jgi:hypothetical protein